MHISTNFNRTNDAGMFTTKHKSQKSLKETFRGYLGSKVQPNHCDDLERDIPMYILTNDSYTVGQKSYPIRILSKSYYYSYVLCIDFEYVIYSIYLLPKRVSVRRCVNEDTLLSIWRKVHGTFCVHVVNTETRVMIAHELILSM